MARSSWVERSSELSLVESVSRMPRCAKPRPVQITLHYTLSEFDPDAVYLETATKQKAGVLPGFVDPVSILQIGRGRNPHLLFVRVEPQAQTQAPRVAVDAQHPRSDMLTFIDHVAWMQKVPLGQFRDMN